MRLRPAVFYGPHSNDSVTLGGQTGRHGDGFNCTGCARARRRTRPHLGDAEGASAEPARFQRAPLATLIEQYDQIHQEKLMNAPTSPALAEKSLPVESDVEAEISKLVEQEINPKLSPQIENNAERIRSSVARLTSNS